MQNTITIPSGDDVFLESPSWFLHGSNAATLQLVDLSNIPEVPDEAVGCWIQAPIFHGPCPDDLAAVCVLPDPANPSQPSSVNFRTFAQLAHQTPSEFSNSISTTGTGGQGQFLIPGTRFYWKVSGANINGAELYLQLNGWRMPS